MKTSRYDYRNLGLTYSTAVAKLWSGSGYEYLLFAATNAVDYHDDGDPSTAYSPTGFRGAVIFAIDVVTGQKRWQWEHLYDDDVGPGVDNSIPPRMALGDIDANGSTERIYVGDMEGHLWELFSRDGRNVNFRRGDDDAHHSFPLFGTVPMTGTDATPAADAMTKDLYRVGTGARLSQQPLTTPIGQGRFTIVPSGKETLLANRLALVVGTMGVDWAIAPFEKGRLHVVPIYPDMGTRLDEPDPDERRANPMLRGVLKADAAWEIELAAGERVFGMPRVVNNRIIFNTAFGSFAGDISESYLEPGNLKVVGATSDMSSSGSNDAKSFGGVVVVGRRGHRHDRQEHPPAQRGREAGPHRRRRGREDLQPLHSGDHEVLGGRTVSAAAPPRRAREHHHRGDGRHDDPHHRRRRGSPGRASTRPARPERRTGAPTITLLRAGVIDRLHVTPRATLRAVSAAAEGAWIVDGCFDLTSQRLPGGENAGWAADFACPAGDRLPQLDQRDRQRRRRLGQHHGGVVGVGLRRARRARLQPLRPPGVRGVRERRTPADGLRAPWRTRGRPSHVRAGVTLIELMVVLVIMAIIVTLSTQTYIAFVAQRPGPPEDRGRPGRRPFRAGDRRAGSPARVARLRHGPDLDDLGPEPRLPPRRADLLRRSRGRVARSDCGVARDRRRQAWNRRRARRRGVRRRPRRDGGEINGATPGMPRTFSVSTLSNVLGESTHTLQAGDGILVGDYLDASWAVLRATDGSKRPARAHGDGGPRAPRRAGTEDRRRIHRPPGARAPLLRGRPRSARPPRARRSPRAGGLDEIRRRRGARAAGSRTSRSTASSRAPGGPLAACAGALAAGHEIATESAALFGPFGAGAGPVFEDASSLRAVVFSLAARSVRPIADAYGDAAITLDGVELPVGEGADPEAEYVRRAYELTAGIRNTSLGAF